MSDRPILFSVPMVRALLDGRKTQTRRLFKGIEQQANGNWHIFGGMINVSEEDVPKHAPDYLRIQPDDWLWVREEFSGPYQFKPKVNPPATWPVGCDLWYWADGNPDYGDWTKPKPPMHMPRWMSRLTLIVTDVRVQRLQDISDEDSIAEGIEFNTRWDPVGQCKWRHYGKESAGIYPPSASYGTLWDSINGPGSWDADPWVAAYTFTVVKQNIDEIEQVAV